MESTKVSTMPNTETYGAVFLATLDASLKYKLLCYKERQQVRQMDRDEVIAKFRLNRYSTFRGIAELPPAEAAQRFADELIKAQQKSATALSAGLGFGEVATLLSLL